MIYDKKIKLLFELYDDAKKGYLEQVELKNMLLCVEMLFSKEKATIKINNDGLYLNNAKLRGE